MLSGISCIGILYISVAYFVRWFPTFWAWQTYPPEQAVKEDATNNKTSAARTILVAFMALKINWLINIF